MLLPATYIRRYSEFISSVIQLCPSSARARAITFGVLLLALILSAGCSRKQKREAAYVSAPQVYLRDRVAAVYEKVGLARNGERVVILDRARRFARVRTPDGHEGWVEQRYLVGQDVFDAVQKMEAENRGTPIQATGVTRNDTNLHLTPSRDADHLYQLKEGEKVQILKRATAEKPQPALLPVKQDVGSKREPPKPIIEDWWLIRDAQGQVGWVLGRMLDTDVPMEIAQYAEGQRIVASFVLNEVRDADKKVAQYLVVATEPRDGLPFDYNQFRVFTWNLKRHRYETAYRERNLFGALPVTVSQENFDKNEGVLPVFVVRVQDATGNFVERKYKLNTPIVRRVLAPGEQPSKAAAGRGSRRSRRTR